MRLPVPGTIARGQLRDDDRLYRGLEAPLANPQSLPMRQVSLVQDPAQDNADEEQANGEQQIAWTDTIPLPVTEELMRRGREQFNIYCATCHGRAGYGDGVVSRRALSLQQGTWVPPTSLHAEHVRKQPVGQLFNTITYGIRKMRGYADQIDPEDRWAVVVYVRALQRSQNANTDDVPATDLPTLRDLK